MDDEEFPEEILDSNSQLRKQMSAHSNPKKKQRVSRAQIKAKKYGSYKKKSKVNTANSTNDMSDFSVKKMKQGMKKGTKRKNNSSGKKKQRTQ